MAYSKDSFQLRGIALTNVGQVRSHNEDSVHLWTRNETLLLAIVADGMGGAAAGEEASRIAIETITRRLGVTDIEHPNEVHIPTNMLRSAVEEANLHIMKEAIEHPQNKGMGTTVTMVFVDGNEARFAHVGDSRAYRVNKDGAIEQITADHSFVQALIDAGHITPEQAETHPMRNVLYRALGQTRDLDVDTYQATLHHGDKLVLCSDGLTGHVRANEIAKIAHTNHNPYTIAETLVGLANSRGGEDNISVIVVIADENKATDDLDEDTSHQDVVEQFEENTRRLDYDLGLDDDDETLFLSSPHQDRPDSARFRLTLPTAEVNRRESVERRSRSHLMPHELNTALQGHLAEGLDTPHHH